jgi:hypothetical protein
MASTSTAPPTGPATSTDVVTQILNSWVCKPTVFSNVERKLTLTNDKHATNEILPARQMQPSAPDDR